MEADKKEAIVRTVLRITAVVASGWLIVALTALWHPMSGESESSLDWMLLWPLCWFGSIALFTWNVPMLVLETRYRAYPRSKYEYAFPSLGIWIVCAIIAGAASSAVTEAVMSDIEVPDPVMEWLVRISLLGLGMAGLALIHPTPTPRRPARGSSSHYYWTALGMASQEPDLDSINERLKRIERHLGSAGRY